MDNLLYLSFERHLRPSTSLWIELYSFSHIYFYECSAVSSPINNWFKSEVLGACLECSVNNHMLSRKGSEIEIAQFHSSQIVI